MLLRIAAYTGCTAPVQSSNDILSCHIVLAERLSFPSKFFAFFAKGSGCAEHASMATVCRAVRNVTFFHTSVVPESQSQRASAGIVTLLLSVTMVLAALISPSDRFGGFGQTKISYLGRNPATSAKSAEPL